MPIDDPLAGTIRVATRLSEITAAPPAYVRLDPEGGVVAGLDTMWKMAAQGIDMSVKWFWIDIFCLDQQHPDKMETIKRSNEIYALAKYYFVIGLACFNRLWCTMELACKLGGQNGDNTDVVVTDFEGFLGRREEAYALSQLDKDPTFETCRYTSATDVPIVKEKILAKFEDIAAFNDTIKNVADVILKEKREVIRVR